MPLQNLPPELVTEVISHLPTAKSVSNFSQVNRATHELVEKDGWRAFVTNRFPSIPITEGHRRSACSLTTLSRSWDRRALLAQCLEPSSVLSLPTRALHERWLKPAGQTMGFRPVVDSYEDSHVNVWNGRREVIAWSAGAEVVMRTRYLWAGRISTQRDERWFSYRPPDAKEGVGDVTALKLLTSPYRSRNRESEREQQFIYGTANGLLSYISLEYPLSKANGGNSYAVSFETNGRSVHSADISPNQDILAGILGEKGSLALYHVPDTEHILQQINPFNERTVVPDGLPMRVWSTKFLSAQRLAVGLGPSSRPIQVYEITPSGISMDPVRKFGIDGTPRACDDRVDVLSPGESARPKSSSVYPIEPLVGYSKSGHAPGDVFLSGGHDGIVRLHDMRSPSAYESCYFDPTDQGAVYSLIALGRERLVTGTARQTMIKFFDLRVSGGRNYWYDENASSDEKVGWNLFLTNRSRGQANSRPWHAGRRAGLRNRRPGGSRESSVYSLSSPSSSSTAIYAGIEDDVIQLDMVDSRHSGDIYRSCSSMLHLTMYEQSTDGAIPLRVQRPLDQTGDRLALPGYDELWVDNRT